MKNGGDGVAPPPFTLTSPGPATGANHGNQMIMGSRGRRNPRSGGVVVAEGDAERGEGDMRSRRREKSRIVGDGGRGFAVPKVEGCCLLCLGLWRNTTKEYAVIWIDDSSFSVAESLHC
jgi:hypothetical protein